MFKLAFEKFPRFCGNFSINGSADQGKDGGAGRVFPQQGGQQQGEQQVDKVLGGKPLVKCPGAHLGVLGQHSEEELLDVRPGPLHSTLAGVQFLLGCLREVFLDLPVKPVRRSSAQILIIYTIIVSRSVGKMFFMFQISFLQGMPQKNGASDS